MKKLIFIFISVLLLASCSQGVQSNGNVSASPIVTVTEITQTPLPTADLPSPSPSPTYTFVSSGMGEKVSEYFYTGDLEMFFTLQPEELISLLGDNCEDQGYDFSYYEYNLSYGRYNISLHYTPDLENDHIIPGLPLARVVISDFDFRNLNTSSNFVDVISTLGETDLLTLHQEGGFYYALCYTIDGLQYEFSGSDERGTGGLTLTVASSSYPQFFYQSCKKGENVSKTLTTGDIKAFLKFSPEKLRDMLGEANGEWGDEDTGIYGFHYHYLGASFLYTLGFEEDDITYLPALPLKSVGIKDFEFRGLNEGSTIEDIMNTLGKTKVITEYAEDSEYYTLRYKIAGMLFVFSGSDVPDDGVSLSIKSIR